MKKLISFSLVVLGFLMFSTKVEASASVRGAKAKTVINLSATAVLACKGPATVYSVILGTGATTDFGVLRDSATANTTSAESVVVPAATAFITQVTFDPPLIFTNGVSFNVPATMRNAAVTCEIGRVLQGY